MDKSPVLVKAVRVRMMPLNKPKKWRRNRLKRQLILEMSEVT